MEALPRDFRVTENRLREALTRKRLPLTFPFINVTNWPAS